MKNRMKSIWSSAFFSFLLLVLVLLFFGFGFVTATALPVRLFAAAMALYCLELYTSAVHPDGRIANKLVRVFTVCANGLSCVALLVIVLEYFAARA